MFFWNSLAFSVIQRMLAIWSLVPLPFLKPAWTSGSSRFTYCWSLAWRILSITRYHHYVNHVFSFYIFIKYSVKHITILYLCIEKNHSSWINPLTPRWVKCLRTILEMSCIPNTLQYSNNILWDAIKQNTVYQSSQVCDEQRSAIHCSSFCS